MVQNDSQINTHVFAMVNGEGPSVPITTLACIQSLTDLPLELPLPTPLPGVTGHQSLLSHLRDSEEARRLLNTQDSILIPSLIDALDQTTIDHIEVKDGYYEGGSHSGKKSQLVQYLLGRNPSLFKGSVHGPQSGDHHASSGQWLQKECSDMSVHPQQNAFNASTVSPCQPHQAQGNSLDYFPLDHPPNPQATRIAQNKTQNVQPKSFLTYSPYDHTLAPSGQQHSISLRHSAISQDTGDSLPSDLQENSQMLNSLVKHIVNVPMPSPAVHLFSNGNCVDEVDLAAVSAKQNDRTENYILDVPQMISNVIPNCSQTNPNDVSAPSPSSIPLHVNSSSVIVESSVPHLNCIKKRVIEQWQSVPNNSFEISQSGTCENVSNMQNSESTLQHVTVSGSESKKETEIKSKEKIENENASKPGVISEKRRVSATEPVVVLSKLDDLQNKKLKNAQKRVCQKTKGKKSSSPEKTKVSVQKVVSKISSCHGSSTCQELLNTPQDINSSVIIPGPSAQHVNCIKKCPSEQRKSVPNHSSENSCSETCIKEIVNNMHNSESTVQSATKLVSEPNKETEVNSKLEKIIQNENAHSSAVISKKTRVSTAEPVVILSQLSLQDQLLAQKSIHQLTIKDNELISSDPIKVSVQDKVLEVVHCRRSSTCKKADTRNKSSQRKSSNSECFPQTIKDKEKNSSSEPVKVSVKNKISGVSNRRSSSCNETDASTKSSERKNSNNEYLLQTIKGKKIDSSPESVKASVQNKVSEISNRHRSSTCKETDVSTKSHRRKGSNNEYLPQTIKGTETDSSHKSVKVPVENKVSETSNRRRSSACKETNVSTKSPKRNHSNNEYLPQTIKGKETGSSSELVKVPIQNKVSEISNCRRSSTCKETDVITKSPRKKGSNNKYLPQSIKGKERGASPELTKLPDQNKILEISTCKETDVITKSPRKKGSNNKCLPQCIKGKETDSSPELAKLPDQNKILEISNRHRSSSCKEADISSKSSPRKGSNSEFSLQTFKCKETDSSPELIKAPDQNKASENSNNHQLSICKEAGLSNKSRKKGSNNKYSPQTSKDTETISSPQPVKLSAQNKVPEIGNRRRSSPSKKADISNKSPQRKSSSNKSVSQILKDKETTPSELIKVSPQSKVSEIGNCRRFSTSKEVEMSNKSSRRKSHNNESYPETIKDKDTDSSPEPAEVFVQNKISKTSNRRRSSTCKEVDISNKSPQRKSSNECFSSNKNSELVKEKGLKRSLNSSCQKNSSPPNKKARKMSISSSQANCIKSSNLEDEKCHKSYKEESPRKPVLLTSKMKKIQNNRISPTEPVVILTKLSLEDQLLAQKSVRQFIIKCKRAGSYDPVSAKNKFSEVSNRRRSSTCKERDISNESPRRKTHDSEYFHDRKSSLSIKEKEMKRKLNSLEKINKSATSNSRARKRHCSQAKYIESSNSEDEKSDESYKEESSEEAVPSILKTKKLKNKKAKGDLTSEPLSIEDLMDSNTYQHFSRIVDVIFDSLDGVDFSAEIEEDAESATESLLPITQLQELRNEAAKLKRLHAMSQFPPERLIRLLAILERNIVDGAKLLPVQMMEEQDEEEAHLWLELTMERLMRSADASLTALYVMTSPKMPEKVFIEDVIERIVVFLKYQLQNTVFPLFDPAYRLDPKSKTGYAGNIKQKRAHAHKVKEKSFLKLYNKLHEALSLFAELLQLQTFTDTIILHVSTLGVSPFFVEGISELQLSALRLVTTVFAHYEKHRSLILEDILSSIARLPTSKRSLRNYRLNSEESIQMLTALVLQLIHSVIRLPESKIDPKSEFSPNEEKLKANETKEKVYIDKDVLIITSYEASVKTAVGFLSVFLKKCGTKSEEMDYRPLFENFVQDLLSTVNKPEWPASELLLSLLGRMLVRNFSNKSMEMTLRVASLDYLGLVAARLRKDAVTSQDRQDMINDIIQRIVSDSDDQDSSPTKTKKKKKKSPVKQDEVQILQKALLQYLDLNATNDPALQFSRRFYIAQWYRDATMEVKRSDKSLNFPREESPEKSDPVICSKNKSHHSRKGRRRSSQVTYEEEKEEEEKKEECKLESDEVNAKVLALAEERKRFLLTAIKQQELTKVNVKEEKHIDYKTAELIAQYLASTRYFSQSFDLYLSQILCVLSETAVAVRTKAMKCLTLVVEADPSILARPDMRKGVHGRLLDQSTSVREAAVDLLGKFILIRPELISQYYEMLTARILDTGVSVRKRVIRILKDICLEQPDFPQTPEICVKIIRRVNDEEGIKKLVGEVFQSMWFSPVSDKKQDRILQKVKNVTHVVEACRDTGLEWFEQLLTNLLKNKDDGNYKSVVKSCKQIVDCLVEKLLLLEESQNVDSGASSHLVACLTTLHLFSKIYPPFVVPHAITIQPYLSMKCNTQSDFLSLKYVAQTLELVVPLMEHPSESFLAQIEEDVVKLILQQHMGLLPSCVSCLGSVVNKVTHNYQFVKDCFQKFFAVILVCKKGYEKNPENEMLKTMRPKLLRSLYTVGLFCRHFDFDVIDTDSEQNGQISLKNRVFESIMYFNQHDDEDIRLKALTGLGFIMIRHYEFMLGPNVQTLYHNLLTSHVASSLLKCQVLKNITNYLVEEEMQMIQKDSEWKEMSKSEDLKEMGDVTSGMASTVIQVYLKQILECVLHSEVSCRKASLSVIQLILSQGLVHPVQIVPYLVCLGSDDDPIIQTKADQLLQEIEKKYPGFIQMKAMYGVRMSFKMQQLIQNPNGIVRGFRCPETPISRNGFLYSLMRSTKQSRRAFLCSLMKLFDEQARTPLTELLYIADNIAYFSYMAQDEPLFIMHQLDIMLSVSGSNLLQTFRETLSCKQSPEATEHNSAHREVDDDDDDDFEIILGRLPETTEVLQECIIASQGCILLLYIKQTLKEMYGFTDNKIQQYSPNEAAKVYERPLNRKGHVRFNPDTVLNFMKIGDFEGELDDQGKEKLVEQYLHFKQLMLTIDPADDEEEDSQTKHVASTLTVSSVTNSTEKTEVTENSDKTKPAQLPLEEAKVVTSRKSKSPSHSRSHRKSLKTPKEKVRKKRKKKRKRILDSASEDSASDPDYMDSS